MRDSFDDLKLSVECHIQDLNNISQIPSDFELDFDEDSEISFFTSSSSLGGYGKA